MLRTSETWLVDSIKNKMKTMKLDILLKRKKTSSPFLKMSKF